jgi:hypothetical protein
MFLYSAAAAHTPFSRLNPFFLLSRGVFLFALGLNQEALALAFSLAGWLDTHLHTAASFIN